MFKSLLALIALIPYENYTRIGISPTTSCAQFTVDTGTGCAWMLHDPHTRPEPVLVLSGTTYLIPAYMAYKVGALYNMWSYLFLTATTIGFHGTRNEFLFYLDCLAILNYINCSIMDSKQSPDSVAILFWLSLGYSLTSYFIGQRFQIMSFDPDWNTQMGYHAMMHVSTAYSAYIFMNERFVQRLITV